MLTIPNEDALIEKIVAAVYAEHGDKSGLPLDQLPPENLEVRRAKARSSLRTVYGLMEPEHNALLRHAARPATAEAAIEGDQIVIRVGIPFLPHAVGVGPTGYKVTDADVFAGEMVRALNRDEEDGTTLIHLMLDRATEDVIESGGEGVDEDDAGDDDQDDEAAAVASLHPARRIPFAELEAGLAAAAARGHAYRRPGPAGLELWVYSQACVFANAWDAFTTIARGLILCPGERKVVATPFPKFFNMGEGGRTFPDLPFETFEKLDGSLIIIFHHAGAWWAATKGAFASPQAQWAQARLDATDLSPLVPGATYLAEATYPENRIVVHYAEPALVLLGSYDDSGWEMPYDYLANLGKRLGWPVAERHAFASLAALVDDAKILPAQREGFVIRFDDGTRLKVKGAEYRRIHALISRVTPLAVWEAMHTAGLLDTIRRDIPEEFWGDFDAIRRLLDDALSALVETIAAEAGKVAGLSDKELGLSLDQIPAEVRSFIFPFRREGQSPAGSRLHKALLREIRPDGNELAGYIPSYAMARVMEDGNG